MRQHHDKTRKHFTGVILNLIQPNVSVIVPAYNSGKTLTVCLKTLSKQTYPSEKYEVIIVDDGSTDNTSIILNSLPESDLFKVINHSENCGLAAARNTGIKNAKGDILIFLDSDMEVEEDFIEKHVSFHRKKSVIGVLGSIIPDIENPYDKYQRYLYESKRGAAKFDINKPIPFNAFIFNNTSIKKIAFEKVGLFDENIKMYGGEDTEFSYRVWNYYPEGLYCDPSIVVIHHHYRTIEKTFDIIEEFGEKVVPYLIKKHPGLAKLYGLNFLNCKIDDVNFKTSLIKSTIGFIIRRKLMQNLTMRLYKIAPFPLSNPLVRILMASSLLRGIDKSLQTL